MLHITGDAQADALLDGDPFALLGTQRGYDGDGWVEASAPYGETGSFRSVTDITSTDSLAKVREHKRAVKAAAKA